MEDSEGTCGLHLRTFPAPSKAWDSFEPFVIASLALSRRRIERFFPQSEAVVIPAPPCGRREKIPGTKISGWGETERTLYFEI